MTNLPGGAADARPNFPVTRDGARTTFQGGVVYRHAGAPPLLEVTGTHYEMGLQYGVLLQTEVAAMVAFFWALLRVYAEDSGAPEEALLAQLRAQTEKLAQKLPARFLDEMRGVADGTGLPFETVQLFALTVDVMAAKSCASVLMRGADGAVLHGHNADMFGFSGEHTVVVRCKATGYHAFTQYDFPLLFLGAYKAGNDQGLTHTEETLRVRETNPDGFSLYYLIRMALEECSTLDQVCALLDQHRIMGASGSAWASQREQRGMIAELTPQGWARIELGEGLVWNFNRLYTPAFQAQQHPQANMGRSDFDRDHAAVAFPVKNSYTVNDALAFLRLQAGQDGSDYAWCGTRWPICNMAGQQMIVFHPEGDGAYLAWGRGFAARRPVYHIHADFARPPEVYRPAQPLPPLAEALAEIENSLISRRAKFEALIQLAEQHPGDANLRFLVARKSFLLSQPDTLAEYADQAYALNPALSEYRLYAGLAAYRRGDMERARLLLEPIPQSHLFPEQELYRLWVLEAIYNTRGSDQSAAIRRRRQIILDDHNAHPYYETTVVPWLTALAPASPSRPTTP
jgi:hypothetical protein